MAYLAAGLAPEMRPRGEIFAVSDGMGGHQAGRQAAEEVCRGLKAYYNPELELADDRPETAEIALLAVLEALNQSLAQKGAADPFCHGWGATLSALVIRPQGFIFAHTGDSRIFLFREGRSTLLTEDQNVAYQMYRHDQLTYSQYLQSPGHNYLFSYMGQGEEIVLTSGRGEVRDGDIFLLSSDGLNQFAQIYDMDRIIAQSIGAGESCDDLLTQLHDEFTHKVVQPKAARDNVTFTLLGIQAT